VLLLPEVVRLALGLAPGLMAVEMAEASAVEVLVDLRRGKPASISLPGSWCSTMPSRSRWCSYMRIASNPAAPASSSWLTSWRGIRSR
jgi:hypothetical protein